MKQETSIILCIRESKILLGIKKRGHGAGYWNGFGGKKLPNETILDSALREIKEEAEIIPQDMMQVGTLEFTNFITYIYIFSEFKGEPVETEEMRPQWFNIQDIPYNQMWESDKLWLPLILDRKKIKGEFFFDGDRMVGYNLEIIS